MAAPVWKMAINPLIHMNIAENIVTTRRAPAAFFADLIRPGACCCRAVDAAQAPVGAGLARCFGDRSRRCKSRSGKSVG
jgi:hypothetical protein